MTIGLVFRWVFTVMTALGGILSIITVGQPREPISGGTAAATTVMSVALIYGIWFWV